MKIDFLTLFPEMFEVLNHSIMKRAQDKGIVQFNAVNFRDYADNKHHQVDDYPYGGGQGMVLKPEPIFNALDALDKTDKTRIILMCPQGKPFTQKVAESLAEESHLVFICGHYEGYDERIREHLVTDEISIGDYVLTGGELAAITMTDAIVRLIPESIKEESHKDDSFSTGLLEHPQYTRPADFNGMKVPDVLVSGNHKNIEKWRHEMRLKRTYERRPDLLETYPLTDSDYKYIESLQK
ncbi:tRNA (guanosine(37)-N1)-methyltransferase TrmD [Macrococcus armenti]|uniref:tRNA (guanosine(37)-N1)-methyltransferase TrmD n=1 Tax=Macrococcus armenti TaxID=2875764 RepID=UPI001CCC0C69|nr:tRNA (guanosine(37)-N1)-methyltransferase TrmD [Macrococcus armenti]UBH09535.1 tRNA (guanosine(37)-N1)-methyltransferase TrmD [Macrococcus armenti]UBH11812.1 tRNA (guanosine(37)-N1)-methyltransferase TrmD [Macrococcus armenti]UBH16288.1 tRNA (guanosine(37)-N1)-methyltransferase TrmD [Macrococcus armenti]UBH18646.1 tRNA (guanosine(37)-N1)-methyltransferase TrmD [Macrococcus armenti]UBH20916.1 tRNA (guanosine(37)-N1)-methyltransferase TrmD [Macrococcus armenti]